jgi:site-specific recombinase XerD
MKTTNSGGSVAALVQGFFCSRLVEQQDASPRTVAAYRDTFRLFFEFLRRSSGRAPSQVTIDDFDTDTILRFLRYLEEQRHNCARTRNARLAALRSFIEYAVSRDPALVGVSQQLLAIPMKHVDLPQVQFLTKEEIAAIIDNTDQATWSGRRDRVMFSVLYNTGARVSELIGIRLQDVRHGAHPALRLHGKGRKERTVPLWRSTARSVSLWTHELPEAPTTCLFPDTRGSAISRSGVEYRLNLAVRRAADDRPSLLNKRISPHTFRHTTAMHLLESGVDITVIALWLGHESIQTTHRYVEADMKMKRKAISRLDAPKGKAIKGAYNDELMRFLNSL